MLPEHRGLSSGQKFFRSMKGKKFMSGLAPLFDEFVSYRKASGVWNDNDRSCLIRFDKWCDREFPGQESLCQGMLAWCERRETEAASTFYTRTNIVWRLVDYLRGTGKTTVTYIRPKYAVDRSFCPKLMTDDEVSRFFAECDAYSIGLRGRNGLADKLNSIELPVFYRLLFSSGMRTCEARWLTLEDIDMESGVVTIRKSKCGQHRVVLHQSMLMLLSRYIDSMYKLMPGSTILFPDAKGSPHPSAWQSTHFRKIWCKVSQEPARASHL